MNAPAVLLALTCWSTCFLLPAVAHDHADQLGEFAEHRRNTGIAAASRCTPNTLPPPLARAFHAPASACSHHHPDEQRQHLRLLGARLALIEATEGAAAADAAAAVAEEVFDRAAAEALQLVAGERGAAARFSPQEDPRSRGGRSPAQPPPSPQKQLGPDRSLPTALAREKRTRLLEEP